MSLLGLPKDYKFQDMKDTIRYIFPEFTEDQLRYSANKISNIIRGSKYDVHHITIERDEKEWYSGHPSGYYSYYSFVVSEKFTVYIRINVD